MKKGIHPTYYDQATVVCTCGHTWTTGSTIPEIRTDVCSNCHPFYTGEQRIVDTAGQVERFMKRLDRFSKHKENVVERTKLNRQRMEERFAKQQIIAIDIEEELVQSLHDANIVTVQDLVKALKEDRDSLLAVKDVTPEVVVDMETKLSEAREEFFADV